MQDYSQFERFGVHYCHPTPLCTAFQAIGADARQSTFRDSEEETTQLVEDFSANKFDVLVSVCKFIKGFDDPTVMCVVDVRKNRTSLSEVIQKMGRAMRYAPGKEYALYLDHVRNMEGLVLPDSGRLGERRQRPSHRQGQEASSQADLT